MSVTENLMQEFARYAAEDLNTNMGLPLGYDQSKGNRCDILTYDVMEAMKHRGMFVRRELHEDDAGNWHYILAHASRTVEPTDDDLLTDLNPWQWRSHGGGLLHAPRAELMQQLNEAGAPDTFVALRSIATITRLHDTRINPKFK